MTNFLRDEIRSELIRLLSEDEEVKSLIQKQHKIILTAVGPAGQNTQMAEAMWYEIPSSPSGESK